MAETQAVAALRPAAGPGLTVAELAAVAGLAEASTAASTRRAYAGDHRRFEAWLETRGAGAPTPQLVALYLAEHAALRSPDGSWAYAPATLARWLSSLNAAARADGAPPPGDDPLVDRVMKGIRRTRLTRPRKREPLLLDDLRMMLAAIAAGAEAGGWAARVHARRDAAALGAAMVGAFRRSELAGLDGADLEWHRDDGLRLLVRSSKTDQEGEGEVVVLPFGEDPDPLTCPVCSLARWTEVTAAWDASGRPGAMRLLAGPEPAGHVCRAGIVPPTPGLPLFRSVHVSGRIRPRPMTGHAFNEMLARRAGEAGLDPTAGGGLGGHSPRAGFVTEALRAGATLEEVARQTRHGSTRSVQGYQREADPLRGNAVTRLRL